MANEEETCRALVVPQLAAAGWEEEPHAVIGQHSFTDGQIVVTGGKARRRPRKFADYLLRYRPDFAIAVVEAKASYKLPSDGLQQAKDYASILGLSFAFATNGHGIVEFDYLTGRERFLEVYPRPEELWARLRAGQRLTDTAADRLLTPTYRLSGKRLRYYQELAINRAVQAVLQGNRRMLLTMATGTGKTFVAFQICWKLWNAQWNATGEPRKTRILYLADRNILIDGPKDTEFPPFGDARHKIEHGKAIVSREIYFSTYQAIARDAERPGLYKRFAPNFFDLVIVDECHRGSAHDESSWREILDYFAPAYQLGLTATPKRADNVDTYAYFGNPIYTYSLRQGIADGFLAPYRVHQVMTAWDAAGWRPSQSDIDRYGRAIPDEVYETKDFERVIALRARTQAIARHLTSYMRQTDRFAKTIVFCVDQEHADEMRRALGNLNDDLVRQYPNYVCRITADEGDVGRGLLGQFQDVDTAEPVIVTTSQLLTTGVDVPACKNIVLARVIGSMTEFKQIIGRGTRVRDDYGKLSFTILDYAGSATRRFADPEFDGEPASVVEVEIDEEGQTVPGSEHVIVPEAPLEALEPVAYDDRMARRDGVVHEARKYYFDGGQVEIVHQVVHELDPDGNELRVVAYLDYAGELVRGLYVTAGEVRQRWTDPALRSEIVKQLEARGIDLATLAQIAGQPGADPLDLLCHVAFNAPLRTRRERADRLKRDQQDFFDRYGPEARAVLTELLEKYAEYGTEQFAVPDALKVPPISERGNVTEIARLFGGTARLRQAIDKLQALLYAA